MEHSAPPARKEDHKILIDLFYDERKFTIPCKIYLPETITEEPQIYIFPTHSDFNSLPRLKGKCWFTSANKDHQITVIGEDVHVSGGNMAFWGDDLEEGYLKVYPSRLIIHHNELLSDKNIIWFQLSPSLQLAPHEMREFHYDGSAKVTHSKKKTIQVTNDFSVTFMNRYKWLNAGKKKNITFPELIAEAEFSNPIKEEDVEKHLKLLDDFLLLVSLAEGQRVTLPRLQVYYPDNICDIYRMNFSIPKLPDNHSFNNFLIDQKDFDSFIKKVWGLYSKSKYQDLLRSALVSQVSATRHSMQSRFLSLFSGIETLILAFRLENDLEHVVSKDGEWNKLKKLIKKSIKDQEVVELNKEARGYIYNNIISLNRVPLHHVFETFVKKKGVYHNDLWDFFGDRNGYSLTTIRNRLVHGYGINEKFIASFSMALENLKLYAKRMLLAELGWNFQQSKVFRRDDSFISQSKSTREIISDWK